MLFSDLFVPVLAMLSFTIAVGFGLMFVRVNLMKKLRIHPQLGSHANDLRPKMPDFQNRLTDNYNHLFEQPMVFYILCLSCMALQISDTVLVILAWSYVVLRVMHSYIQIILDKVLLRFFTFLTSWMVLLVFVARVALLKFY